MAFNSITKIAVYKFINLILHLINELSYIVTTNILTMSLEF